MARLTDLDGVHKSQSYTVSNPGLIQVVKGFNARSTFNITELASDIDRSGLLQPLWVRRDLANNEQPFILIDGERRLRALRKLFDKDPKREERIPVIIFDVDEEEAEDLMAKANLEREDFTLAERIGLVQRYLKRGLDVETIGARLNRSVPWVNQLVTLKDASAKLKAAVDSDKVTMSAALMMARKTKVAQQEAALARVIAASGGNKKATTRIAARLTGTSMRPGKKEIMKVLSALETKEVEGAEIEATAARALILMALSFAAGEGDRTALLNACAEQLGLAKPAEPEAQEAQGAEESEEDDGKKSGEAMEGLLDDEND